MRIDDDELRDIFKTSCEERIQAIDQGLLHLEAQPDDLATVEAMLRDAHSLKGDSNMLGQEDLGRLAHQIESVLSEVKRGDRPFTPELGDRLARGMAAVRSMVEEAVTGQPANVQLFYVLADLMGGAVHDPQLPSPDPTVRATPPCLPSPDLAASVESDPAASLESAAAPPLEQGRNNRNGAIAPLPLEPSPPPAEKSIPEPTIKANSTDNPLNSGYRIETVRVPTHHLDSLMTQAGELTVTKIRIAHRLAEAEAIATLWEEWNRDIFANRTLLNHQYDTGKQQHLERFFSLMENAMEGLGKLSGQLTTALSEDITRLESISGELEEGIRTLRLLPLATIFNLFPRLVRDLAREEGKSINFVIEGAETKADKRILEEMKDPLLHLLRNAIDHGIETPAERILAGKPEQATLRLKGYQTGNAIAIEVSDDGRGLDAEAIKEMALRKGLYRSEELDSLTPEQLHTLILSPGFSTRLMVTDVSGRGVGLDVLRTNVEKLKGQIEIESQPGQGCTFRIKLGTALSTAHVLIVAIGQTAYAIPVEYVEKAQLIYADDLVRVNHQSVILHNGSPISVIALAKLLECHNVEAAAFEQTLEQRQRALSCIILKVGMERFGLFVDALLDEQDVVLKPQSQLLKRVRNVLGATILGTGEVCIVLNPPDLLQSIQKTVRAAPPCLPSSAPSTVASSAASTVASSAASSVASSAASSVASSAASSVASSAASSVASSAASSVASSAASSVASSAASSVASSAASSVASSAASTVASSVASSAASSTASSAPSSAASTPLGKTIRDHQTVLLVEDSIATRTQEKRILESAGYNVVTAVDGLDGFSKLQMQHFDAVVSDVQMPNLDGLGLTERIRENREYSELPIILVTTLASDDDRRRGAEAGANAYITKSSFSQDILLDTLERLI